MVVEQIIDIPANHRITIDVPRTVPEGRTILTFTPASNAEKSSRDTEKTVKIEEIRDILRKEMAEKGTYNITSANGDGWESYVRERQATYRF